MPGLIRLCLLCLLVFSCQGDAGRTPRPQEPLTLRVATYNIHGGFDAAGRQRLGRIVEEIRAAKLDIIGIQEVDMRTDRSGNVDQARYLAESLGMSVVFDPTMYRFEGGRFGNALLTRLEIRASRSFRLPGGLLRVRRKALEVLLREPESGHELTVIVTHFSLDEGDRMQSAEWIVRRYMGHVGPVILVGDLNENPLSPAVQLISETWTSATSGTPVPTYPADRPRVQIDYLFSLENGRLSIANPTTPGPPNSDHLLLAADVLLGPVAAADP